jgi:hypothetical protein
MNSEPLNIPRFTNEDWRLIEQEIAEEALSDRDGWQQIDNIYFHYERVVFKHGDFLDEYWKDLEDIPFIFSDEMIARKKNRIAQNKRTENRRKTIFKSHYLSLVKDIIAIDFESQAGFAGLMESGHTALARRWQSLCTQTSEQGLDRVLMHGENLILLFSL